MAEPDEQLNLARLRDLEGRGWHPWLRRMLLAALAVGLVLALTGAIGQPTQTLRAAGTGAELRAELPDVLRGGLMWPARITVRAVRTIKKPRIVLSPGFARGMQLNTIEPSPQSEAGRGGRIVLTYPELNAGDELVVYLQLQANPTTLGGQDTGVELDDETSQIARVAHSTVVLP